MENIEVIKLDTEKPFVVRLVAKNYDKFSQKYKQPFDHNLHLIFILVLCDLLKEFKGYTGYTYEDEIIVLFCNDTEKIKWKFTEILSEMSSYAGTRFNYNITNCPFEPLGKIGNMYFTGNVFSIDNDNSVFNYINWKISRCILRSIDKLALMYFTPKELEGKDGTAKVAMLNDEKKIVWNAIDNEYKFGSLIKRKLYPEKMMVKGKTGQTREVCVLKVKFFQQSLNISGFNKETVSMICRKFLNNEEVEKDWHEINVSALIEEKS
jgi:tRNA(His) 5'-end guanylyltransferase